MDANTSISKQRTSHVKQRPAVRRNNLVRHLSAYGQKPSLSVRCGKSPEIVNRQFVSRHVFEDLLMAIRMNDGSKHVMLLDHPVNRLAEAVDVEAGKINFEIIVGRNITQINRAAAPNPIRLL